MNIRKSWLLSFLIAGFMTTAAFSAPAFDASPESINKQLQKYLQGIELGETVDDQTVFVDFMINEKSEIIVLSTNNVEMDSTIKTRLNYKTVNAQELELLERYTIPISFKK